VVDLLFVIRRKVKEALRNAAMLFHLFLASFCHLQTLTSATTGAHSWLAFTSQSFTFNRRTFFTSTSYFILGLQNFLLPCGLLSNISFPTAGTNPELFIRAGRGDGGMGLTLRPFEIYVWFLKPRLNVPKLFYFILFFKILM